MPGQRTSDKPFRRKQKREGASHLSPSLQYFLANGVSNPFQPVRTGRLPIVFGFCASFSFSSSSPSRSSTATTVAASSQGFAVLTFHRYTREPFSTNEYQLSHSSYRAARIQTPRTRSPLLRSVSSCLREARSRSPRDNRGTAIKSCENDGGRGRGKRWRIEDRYRELKGLARSTFSRFAAIEPRGSSNGFSAAPRSLAYVRDTFPQQAFRRPHTPSLLKTANPAQLLRDRPRKRRRRRRKRDGARRRDATARDQRERTDGPSGTESFF